MIRLTGLLFTVTALHAATWQAPTESGLTLSEDTPTSWTITCREEREFVLRSEQVLPARSGEVFELTVRIQVDLHTRALPEIASYDAAGAALPVKSSLKNGPSTMTTNWQTYRRLVAAQPGSASVRAVIRGAGKGTVKIADFKLSRSTVDPYQTGALISQIYPRNRTGLVLESNLGIVNSDLLSDADRDGDGKWAVIKVDLDALSTMPDRGVDWRTKFEYRPNEIYWSDGVVLKSDTVAADRPPDISRALHFRMKVHPGPYHALLNDPGRSVAISTDGRTWKRYDGGDEPDLGTIAAEDGFIDFYVDACFRDAVSAGPAYFDYVRLFPRDGAPNVETLFRRAQQTPVAPARGTVDDRTVAIRVAAPRYAAGASWPVRCGLPIAQGELADPAHATVYNARGEILPTQNRATATWPDGSVKWLFLDFTHDFSAAAEADYDVHFGNRVRNRAPSHGVRTTATPAGIEVDTGAIRFLVPRDRFGIIEHVRSASGALLQEAPIAAEITEAAGTQWRAASLPTVHTGVERAGRLHTVILTDTALAPSGKPADGFYHRARIHAYADSPLVEVDYFVANTDRRPQVQTRTIALKLAPAVPVAAGIQDFAEQQPKAIRSAPGALSLDLWSDAKGDLYSWIQGVGKTHHIALHYGVTATDTALLGHGPVLAMAAPDYYVSTGAFGPIDTAARSPLPEVEATLDAHLRGPVIAKVGLGFENYGDHSSNGYVAGTYLWDNNEYDLPAGAIIHFVRTGQAPALRVGLAGALHYLDVDTIHYSADHADYAGAAHTHSHADVGHHTADKPNMHHAGYVQGLIWYSYFTGEPNGVDGAQSIAEWVLRNIAPEHNVGQMERAMGHPLMTLNDVYEATWDPRYLRGSARLADWALKWEHPVRSGFLAPITEQPAYYSGAPFCGGILPGALLKFNRWARDPEIDRLLERIARWTLSDMWRPPAGIMSKGGSPSRTSSPQHIASHARLLRWAWERTHDPLFLVSPRAAVAAGFGAGTRGFGTRDTGLVFNNVPWLLSSIAAAGNPQPDQELTVTADSSASFTLRNTGTQPITDLDVSFQPRLDFSVTSTPTVPRTLAPGESLQLRYEVAPPAKINLTSAYNRIAYAQLTATFQRANQARLASAWSSFELK